MFQIRSWSNVILHLDGDAFFASVAQSNYPSLKGKPVVTGSERGIVTSISYEAKKYGVQRGMTGWEIRKTCPACIFVNSNYDLYNLYSQKMFSIIRSFTPEVEEYSIDEAFADIKGIRKPLNMTYQQIGQAIKDKVESSLGITVSVGISLTKSLAKLASSFNKPSGLTVINSFEIENLLKHSHAKDIWGIGENTSAYLQKKGVITALDFASKSEEFIRKNLTKPFYEIWQELRGNKVYELDSQEKNSYKSISDTGTFQPATNNKDILWARLLTHIENVFQKARKFKYAVGKLIIFLKTQQFTYHTKEIKLIEKITYPYLIHELLQKTFNDVYKRGVRYRATGCHITNFEELTSIQPSLFSNNVREEKIKKIYPLFEAKKINFGSMLFDRQLTSKDQKTLKIPLLKINQTFF